MIGTQTFDALGKRWTLFLGTSARVAIEERFDKGFFAVVADAMPDIDPATAMAVAQAMSAGGELPPEVARKATDALRGMRIGVLRDLAWFGLRGQHPEVTPAEVDRIIDDLQEERFGALMQRAIARTQDVGEAGDADPGNAPRPTRRPRPTGRRS